MFDSYTGDWEYTIGLGWGVSGPNSEGLYGIEQAMGFRPQRTGRFLRAYFNFSCQYKSSAKQAILKLAEDNNGQPGDIMEQWIITDFKTWSQYNEPDMVLSDVAPTLEAETLYWLWGLWSEYRSY